MRTPPTLGRPASAGPQPHKPPSPLAAASPWHAEQRSTGQCGPPDDIRPDTCPDVGSTGMGPQPAHQAECYCQSPQWNATAQPDSPALPMARAEPATLIHNDARPTIVYAIGVTVHSLSDVDPTSGRFACDLKVDCCWHDASLESNGQRSSVVASGVSVPGGGSDGEDARWKEEEERQLRGRSVPADGRAVGLGMGPGWSGGGRWAEGSAQSVEPERCAASRPHVGFANGASDVRSVIGSLRCFVSPRDPPGWVHSTERFQGTFHSSMRLDDYPFDRHVLRIVTCLSSLHGHPIAPPPLTMHHPPHPDEGGGPWTLDPDGAGEAGPADSSPVEPSPVKSRKVDQHQHRHQHQQYRH